MSNSTINVNKKIVTILLGLIVLFIACFVILKFMYSLQNISLQRTWRSKETGQVVTFTKEGHVEFEGDLPNGIYHILSPDTMEYTIDHKTFQMFYYIKDSNLYWGIDKEHLECFKLVWF